MRHIVRAKEGCTEEKWSGEWTRSLGKCSARRSGGSRHPGVCMANGSNENFIADADEVHADRSIQYRLLQYERNLAVSGR